MKSVFMPQEWICPSKSRVGFTQQRCFHATQALPVPTLKSKHTPRNRNTACAPPALRGWPSHPEEAPSLPLASCSFSAKWRPEQKQRQTDGVPQTHPPVLSSLLSLLIHLFGWIRSRMEPRWIIMSFLITPCICIPSYSLHGSSWLKWIIYIINIWL